MYLEKPKRQVIWDGGVASKRADQSSVFTAPPPLDDLHELGAVGPTEMI
jgi:hypothetical protein